MDAEDGAPLRRAKCPATRTAICSVDTDYSGQTFKHILVPIWLLTYNYGPRNFQVVINGYTGAIAGKYPKSWVKITLAVLGALATIATLVLIFHR